MSNTLRTNLLRFAAILITATVILSLVELGSYLALRSIKNGLTTPGWPTGQSVTGRPLNTTVTFKSGQDAIEYTTNEFGFRDVSWGHETSGRRRIAIFGDSFTEGWGVKQQDIVAYQLRKMIPNADVLNFGLSGSGPGFARCIYHELAKRYKPDVVIFLSFVGNDFIDAKNEEKVCILDRNPISAKFKFPYSLSLWNVIRLTSEEDVELERIKQHPSYSRISAEYRSRLDRKEVHLTLARFALQDPGVIQSFLAPPTAEQSSAYRNHLSEFIKDTSDSGVKTFVLAAIPFSVQVSNEQFAEFHEMGFIGFESLKEVFSLQSQLHQIATEVGALFSGKFIELDLTPAFEIASKNRRLYLPFDAHTNANGHNLIARELAAVLR